MRLLDILLSGTVLTSGGRDSESALSALTQANPCILMNVDQHERDEEVLHCVTFSACWCSMLAAATLLV